MDLQQVLASSPYRFTFRLPENRIGPFDVFADAVISPGNGATAETVPIQIERSDPPTRFRAELGVLVFDREGDAVPDTLGSI